MPKLEILISEEDGTVLSIFHLTSRGDADSVTNIELTDEVKDRLSHTFEVEDQ